MLRPTLIGLLLLNTGPLSAASPRFAESAATLGVDFVHDHHGSGQKYMPENMGPGVAIFDANGDGRLDIYLVQGAPLPEGTSRKSGVQGESTVNRLFRQRSDGTFEDVTAASGAGDAGYGMGASFGDYDGDGDLDLYVTNFGPNVLLRNRGDGTFEDVTAEAGVGCASWSTGAGFFDADGDGDLDLYVVNYVDFAFDRHKFCGDARRGIRAYCHPDVYEALPDVLYRNDGNGRFTDVSRAAGIRPSPDAKGLGVGFGDLDGDGSADDVYVANDSTMNFLYLGDGRGHFEESALLAGVGFNGAGAAEASMGVGIGDLDGDGAPEIFLTHLDQETNTLYRPVGKGLYADVTTAAGLAAPSLPWVGFGTVLFDHDGDGDLDVFVANGHIIDNIELFDAARRHRQPAQLFDNQLNPLAAPAPAQAGPRFTEISAALGLDEPLVGRGAAAGDLDRDGDLDLVITQNGDRALVLLNQGAGHGDHGNSLAVRLRGRKSNPQGFGARLDLHLEVPEERTKGDEPVTRKVVQVRDLQSSTSYLSQGPPEVTFGLGRLRQARELVICWPSGQVDRLGPLDAGALYTVGEGAGTEGAEILERLPFKAAKP